MATYRADFDVFADLVLPGNLDHLLLSAPGGERLIFRNRPVDAEGMVPGLTVAVIGPADKMETALHLLREVLAEQLDVLGFVTQGRFRIEQPRRLMEWEPHQRDRRFSAYHSYDRRQPPEPGLVPEFCETVETIQKENPPGFALASLRSFRLGLAATQPDDQFLRFWSALERVAEGIKEKEKAPIPCPRCSMQLYCMECGAFAERTPMAKQAIMGLIEKIAEADAPALSKKLFLVRNGLAHGRRRDSIEAEIGEPLQKAVNDVAAIAWESILISILDPEGEPKVHFGHWDGNYAFLQMQMGMQGSFGWEGPEEHPPENKTPHVKIEVTLSKQMNE